MLEQEAKNNVEANKMTKDISALNKSLTTIGIRVLTWHCTDEDLLWGLSI